MTPRMLLSLFALVCSFSPAFAGPEDSVVQIHATYRLPDALRPWTKTEPAEQSGSGFVIEGKRILTVAHVLAYATSVYIQDRNGGDRFDAKIESIGMGIDLATLKLEDESFFEKHPPLSKAEARPDANDPVSVLGFPIGGSQLAVTRGVVSRLDYGVYDDLTSGLRIQVDAAINPGCSGGPVIAGGRLVGIAYAQLSAAENVGYVIPDEEIDAYLEDVKDGRYDGKSRIAHHFQTINNDSLRARLGLEKSTRGIMVYEPFGRGGSSPFQEWDVLTKFAGAPIDNNGSVQYDSKLRLPFTSLIPKVAKTESVPVTVIREGKPVELSMPLRRGDDRLVKSLNLGFPPYFVYGPLVFSPVFQETAALYRRATAIPGMETGNPLFTRLNDRAEFPDEEIVVVASPLMRHRVSKGYDDTVGAAVAEIDGAKIRNLAHLVAILRDGKSEFVTIRFYGLMGNVVYRRNEIEGATNDLMAENGIPKRGSKELVEIWDRKKETAKQ